MISLSLSHSVSQSLSLHSHSVTQAISCLSCHPSLLVQIFKHFRIATSCLSITVSLNGDVMHHVFTTIQTLRDPCHSGSLLLHLFVVAIFLHSLPAVAGFSSAQHLCILSFKHYRIATRFHIFLKIVKTLT